MSDALGAMRANMRALRGCGTSSLQATAAGQAVYARLGYRDICALEMWEYRRS